MKLIYLFSRRERWKNFQQLVELLYLKQQEMNQEIDDLILAIQSKPQSFNEELVMKYIETRSLVEVARYVKLKGIRSKNGTSFSPGDVTELILSEPKDVNPSLLEFAIEIYEGNYKAMQRKYF